MANKLKIRATVSQETKADGSLGEVRKKAFILGVCQIGNAYGDGKLRIDNNLAAHLIKSGQAEVVDHEETTEEADKLLFAGKTPFAWSADNFAASGDDNGIG